MRRFIALPYVFYLLALTTWLSLALQSDSALKEARNHLFKRSEDETLHQLVKRYPQPDDSSSKGTKDAPVDGADGKPHAGPFVESSESSKGAQSSRKKSNSQDKPEPEDGVMNDPTRQPPKKGTTGTEGGVTEKSKSIEAHEDKTGEKKVQKPISPKDADSVLHKEGAEGDEKKSEKSKPLKSSAKSSQVGVKADDEDDRPKGAMSIEVSL